MAGDYKVRVMHVKVLVWTKADRCHIIINRAVSRIALGGARVLESASGGHTLQPVEVGIRFFLKAQSPFLKDAAVYLLRGRVDPPRTHAQYGVRAQAGKAICILVPRIGPS